MPVIFYGEVDKLASRAALTQTVGGVGVRVPPMAWGRGCSGRRRRKAFSPHRKPNAEGRRQVPGSRQPRGRSAGRRQPKGNGRAHVRREQPIKRGGTGGFGPRTMRPTEGRDAVRPTPVCARPSHICDADSSSDSPSLGATCRRPARTIDCKLGALDSSGQKGTYGPSHQHLDK